MSFLPPASASPPMSSASSARPSAEPPPKGTTSGGGDDAEDLRAFYDSGNEAAFTVLVRRHLPLVFHAALRRLRSPALAEEAAQNAFALLARKAASVLRHPERLRAWLHRTAFLEACALARREARLSRLPAPEETPVFSPMTTGRPDLYEELDKALSALPELDRELLLRRYCEGDDFHRIAAAVGKSESACQKRVERALARLNACLHSWRRHKLKITDARMLPADARSSAAEQAAATGAAVAGIIPAKAGVSAPMPPVGTVAAAALRKQAELAGFSGLWAALNSPKAAAAALVTASILASLTGAVTGWGQTPILPASGNLAADPALKRAHGGNTATADPSGKAPAPERRARPLAEVLESIQAGRLQPLLDFLPSADPADLKAILAEDNRVYLSEGSPPPGEARKIALRHWTAIDPQGAFAWARRRDSFTSGRLLPDSSAVLALWLRNDSAAALTAFASLPMPERRTVATGLVQADNDMAQRVMAEHPEVGYGIRWERSVLTEVADKAAGPTLQQQQQLAADVAAGKTDTSVPEEEIIAAFRQTAFQDARLKLDTVLQIPDPELKARVLGDLAQHLASQLPVSSLTELCEALPRSMSRARVTAWLGGKLAEENPEAAFAWLENSPSGLEREVFFRQAAEALSMADPWRLLEIAATSDKPFSSTEAVRAGISGSSTGLTVTAGLPGLMDGNAVDRLLTFAGAEDPVRALKLLAGIAANQPADYTGKPVSALLGKLLAGWETGTGNEAVSSAETETPVPHDQQSLSAALTQILSRWHNLDAAAADAWEQKTGGGKLHELLQSLPHSDPGATPVLQPEKR